MGPYLIDSNVFIQAKNFFYRFDFCSGFWDWIEEAHAAGIVFSVKKVKKELVNGRDDCPARKWAEELPDSFFLDDVADANVMSRYAELMQWAQNGNHYRQAAIDEFARADVADAFLIAAAKAYGLEVVSQEESKPEAKKKIYLPDAARALGVQAIPYYELLTRHANPTFLLK